MSVRYTGQVVDGGALTEVGVHDHSEVLELVEDPVDRRLTDVRLEFLHRNRDLVDGEMMRRHYEHLGDGALGDRDSLVSVVDGREDLLGGAVRVNHEQRLGLCQRAVRRNDTKGA